MERIFCLLAFLYIGSIVKAGETPMNTGNSTIKNYSLLASPDSCVNPFLLDSNFSHLRWPFPSGSWTQRNSWLGANEIGGIGSSWGQGRHTGSQFYAVDWNKVTPEDDCDSGFYSPIGGTVIYVKDNCPHSCIGDASCAGNEVVIQSNVDTSYAFSILHLNTVNVYVGRIVSPGDYLGNIGATGFAIGSHAHCVLFKNIDRYRTGLTLEGPGPDNHAAPFDFSAECGGVGPNNINLNPTTSINDIEFSKYFSVFPNPTTGRLTIIPKTSINNKYTAIIYSVSGMNLFNQLFSGRGDINLSGNPAGYYLLLIHADKKNLKKIIVLH